MENAADALIMAFGVAIFVLALSISISLLGQVRDTSNIVFDTIDRENDYIYVENPSPNRQVGIETVVSSIYRAYEEYYKIEFLDKNGNPFPIYKTKLIKEDDKNSINIIDLEDEKSRTIIEATEISKEVCDSEKWTENKETIEEFLSYLIGGGNNKYFEYITADKKGLYNTLKGKKITEYLGEYYIQDLISTNDDNDISEANKTKKRVITYVIE